MGQANIESGICKNCLLNMLAYEYIVISYVYSTGTIAGSFIFAMGLCAYDDDPYGTSFKKAVLDIHLQVNQHMHPHYIKGPAVEILF
jgi:hypothetical protein